MSNGTINNNSNKGLTREVVALFLLILGVPSVIGGVGMIWGWGGILLLFGLATVFIGYRLGLMKTDTKRKG